MNRTIYFVLVVILAVPALYAGDSSGAAAKIQAKLEALEAARAWLD